MIEIIERVSNAIGQKLKPALEGGKPVTLEEVARAAIEAMREPTDKMLEAAATVDRYAEPGDEWRPMIDAALDIPSQITPDPAGSRSAAE